MEFDKTERNGEMFAQPFANDVHQGSLVSFYQPSDTGDQTSAKILSNVDVKLQVNLNSITLNFLSFIFPFNISKVTFRKKTSISFITLDHD